MALSRLMWFGTKQFSRWVKTHSPGSDYSMGGYSERLDYLNGGVGMRGSINGHAERTITWGRMTAREAREVTDFASGAYGDGPFYFSDPVAMEQNVLNKQWSMPALTGKDGVPLIGDARPELISNGDQTYGYPTQMAKYTTAVGLAGRSFYVPVPPGCTAWVGVHGDIASLLGVSVQPMTRGVATGQPTVVPVTGVNTTTRVTNSFNGGDQTGIGISLQSAYTAKNLLTNPGFETGSGTVTVRTNYAVNPNFETDLSSWTAANAATLTRVTTEFFSGTASMQVTTPGTATGEGAYSTPATPVGFAAGGAHSQAIRVKAPSGAQMEIVAVTTGTGGSTTTTRFTGTGAWQLVKAENSLASSGANPYLVIRTSMAAGATAQAITFYVDEAQIELAPIVGSYFDGGRQASPDADLSTAWNGPVNASVSVLTGVGVAGVTAGNCAVIRSSRWKKAGSYSMRLIPTSSNNNTYAGISIPAAAQGGGTFVATRYQEAALTGALATSNYNIQSDYPSQWTPRTNVVGETNDRLTFDARTSTNMVYLSHGGAQGSGDVWWDLATLVAGTYTGPAFTGSSANSAWDGAADASTSTKTFNTSTIAGMIVQVLPTGVTPEAGPFISGQGQGGMSFEGRVQATPYSLAHDSFGLSVKLVETEA